MPQPFWHNRENDTNRRSAGALKRLVEDLDGLDAKCRAILTARRHVWWGHRYEEDTDEPDREPSDRRNSADRVPGVAAERRADVPPERGAA